MNVQENKTRTNLFIWEINKRETDHCQLIIMCIYDRWPIQSVANQRS